MHIPLCLTDGFGERGVRSPAEIKRREVELGSHRELDNLLLQVSTVASGTLSLSICFAQFVETAISEAHKVALHWQGPHLLNITVLAVADVLFGLCRSERADELFRSLPPPPALSPPSPPFLISLVVSLDVKHHVHLDLGLLT